jgi:hypothetical protein
MRIHRQIVAYHGCLVDRFERALLLNEHPPYSDEPYDWLGRGLYFWEHGPHRALDWAKQKAKREKRPDSEARVLGAVINLGRCLDLMDVQATGDLELAFEGLRADFADAGLPLPENRRGRRGDEDRILRFLDCAVVNLAAEQAAAAGRPVQTVRAAFWEGGDAFPGAAIQRESHIQVSVRDTNTILHYFNGMNDAVR